MKKALASLLILAIGAVAFADIQSPPGDKHTPVRKLSRAVANIIYGPLEIATTFEKTLKNEGGKEAFSYGVINGLDRAGMRIGYGLYELVNFRTPVHKDSFRAPYALDTEDTVHGYTEFPSSAGFTSSNYVRRQHY